VQRHQYCALLDLVADAIAYLFDRAVVRGDDSVLHFIASITSSNWPRRTRSPSDT